MTTPDRGLLWSNVPDEWEPRRGRELALEAYTNPSDGDAFGRELRSRVGVGGPARSHRQDQFAYGPVPHPTYRTLVGKLR